MITNEHLVHQQQSLQHSREAFDESLKLGVQEAEEKLQQEQRLKEKLDQDEREATEQHRAIRPIYRGSLVRTRISQRRVGSRWRCRRTLDRRLAGLFCCGSPFLLAFPALRSLCGLRSLCLLLRAEEKGECCLEVRDGCGGLSGFGSFPLCCSEVRDCCGGFCPGSAVFH